MNPHTDQWHVFHTQIHWMFLFRCRSDGRVHGWEFHVSRWNRDRDGQDPEAQGGARQKGVRAPLYVRTTNHWLLASCLRECVWVCGCETCVVCGCLYPLSTNQFNAGFNADVLFVNFPHCTTDASSQTFYILDYEAIFKSTTVLFICTLH